MTNWLTWPYKEWFYPSITKCSDWEWSWSERWHSWRSWRRSLVSRSLTATRWAAIGTQRSCCLAIAGDGPSSFEQRTRHMCRSERNLTVFVMFQINKISIVFFFCILTIELSSIVSKLITVTWNHTSVALPSKWNDTAKKW